MRPYQSTQTKSIATSGIPSGRTPSGGAPEGSGGASLGTIANNSPISHQSGFAGVRKYERYALQSAARSALPRERVSKCLRVPTSSVAVEIHKTLATNTYHYQNLQTCGSVWHCPCCAAKISEKRQKEVKAVIDEHRAQGGEVLLLTVTLPHHINLALKTTLTALQKAHTAFEKAREYREEFGKRYGLVGRIRATEVTYGDNGWHPHYHVLLFVGKVPNLDEVRLDLLALWQKVVVRQGFDEPNHHGLSLDNGDKAAEYVGKWGLEHEVTKSHIKRSRKGLTPFDLLRVIVGTYAGTYTGVDVFDAVTLFRDYGETFKGRRQLTWSPGLRDRFNLDEEKTDEELAQQVDEKTAMFVKLPLSLWRVILSQEKRGEVLAICEQGENALFDYCCRLLENAGYKGAS